MMPHQGLCLGLLGMAVLLLCAQPARAVEWFTDASDGAVTTSALLGGESVAVRCEGGELRLAVKVRKSDLDPALGNADRAFVVTTADPGDASAASFTARASANTLGSSYSYVLSAKDSASRLAALQTAKMEMEFALLTEPGGTRYNAFRLPVAGLGEALHEVLGACATTSPQQPAAPATETVPPPEASSAEAQVTQLAAPSWSTSSQPNFTFVSIDAASAVGTASIMMACSSGALNLLIGGPQQAFDAAVIGRAKSAKLHIYPRADTYTLKPSGDDANYYFSLGAEDTGRLIDALLAAPAAELRFDIVSDTSEVLFRMTAGGEGLASGLADVMRACSVPPPSVDSSARPEIDGVWQLTADSDNDPAARVDFQNSRLSFSCLGGEVYFIYEYPALNKELLGLDHLTIVLAIDPAPDGSRASYSVDVPFRPADSSHLLAFKGTAAIDWGRIAQRASRTISISLTKPNHGNKYFAYNSVDFPAKGSTAAIKSLLAACK